MKVFSLVVLEIGYYDLMAAVFSFHLWDFLYRHFYHVFSSLA